ncbi:response regulator transcription factor [Konateibacter massiliensis]|uniref:response regulator transcription factor n=1 Tax=Konateibacter massiliensis TaxID=2002841 RepID=UPI0015D50572|nr:response regulator [Konateibacter massiliensis]
MSIKVLLVDDEKLERVLIRNGFDWEGNGFEIVGEAGSGEEAMEYMLHRKPQIVLTDISMPHMDGLELSEKILKEDPSCRIIIVTGYREFDYARRAVKIGVEDFLLKPVNIDEIAELAGKIKEEIRQEENQVKAVEELKASVLADQDIVMESFFQRLVECRIPEEEARRKLMLYNCENIMKGCICLNLKLKEDDGERLSKEHKQVFDLIKEQDYDNVICFTHYMQNILIYFTDSDYKRIKDIAVTLHETLDKSMGIPATIGISEWNTGFFGIANAFEQSKKAISASVFLGRNRCVTYKEYEEVMNQNENKNEIDWEDFLFAVQNCLVDKVEEYIKEYVDLIRGARMTDMEYLRLMTMNILTRAGTTLNKYGIGLSQLIGEERIYKQVRHINTVEEITSYLEEVMHIIMEYHESKKLKQGNKVVEEAATYISENLFDPELSLRLVASKIYSNESYLSRVFKKEKGISLIEYILKKRIEESIRLLNTTDLKVYEIAEKIGFRDSHYFSICFKKLTGVTVKEFKREKY